MPEKKTESWKSLGAVTIKEIPSIYPIDKNDVKKNFIEVYRGLFGHKNLSSARKVKNQNEISKKNVSVAAPGSKSN